MSVETDARAKAEKMARAWASEADSDQDVEVWQAIASRLAPILEEVDKLRNDFEAADYKARQRSETIETLQARLQGAEAKAQREYKIASGYHEKWLSEEKRADALEATVTQERDRAQAALVEERGWAAETLWETIARAAQVNATLTREKEEAQSKVAAALAIATEGVDVLKEAARSGLSRFATEDMLALFLKLQRGLVR